MRLLNSAPLSATAAVLVLVAACDGDPAATAAPTAPSFSQTSTILADHVYSLALSCSNAAPNSYMDLIAGSVPGSARGFCGQAVVGFGFKFVLYSIYVQDQFATLTSCTPRCIRHR
jgi:hypothetical protein